MTEVGRRCMINGRGWRAHREETLMHIRLGLALLPCFLILVSPLPGHGEVFVTKDGEVYVGDAVGRLSESILIKTADGHVSLKLSDLVELPPAILQAKGAVHEAERYAALAERALKGKEPAVAIALWQSAIDELAAVPAEAEEESEQAKTLTAQYRENLRQTAEELDERGLAPYKGRMFPKAVLAHHLKAGHVLVGMRFWIEPSQLCAECNGKGRLLCRTCHQTGIVRRDCPECTGGTLVCPHCQGTGWRRCPTCLGAKKITRQCRACGGAGDVVCPDCDGRGTKLVRCPECDGKGRVVVSRRWIRIKGGHLIRDDVMRTCPRCEGARRVRVECPTCGGTGRDACPYCNGSGRRANVCTTCRGRGVVTCPTILTCRRCRGIGSLRITCPDCHGKGYLTCPECEGRGFKGDPQPDPPPKESDKPEAKKTAEQPKSAQ